MVVEVAIKYFREHSGQLDSSPAFTALGKFGYSKLSFLNYKIKVLAKIIHKIPAV